MNQKLASTQQSARFVRLPGWLRQQALYLTKQGQLFGLNSQGELVACEAQKATMLILSRHCYQEQQERFPIASASELNKVLRLRSKGQLQYHFIGALHNGQRNVLTITPQPSCQSHCQNARWVFPVSLLLATAAKPGLTEVITPDGTFYSVVQPDGHWQSLPSNPLIQSAEQAAVVLGAHQDSRRQQLAGKQLAQLWDQLWRLNGRYWLDGLNQRNQKNNVSYLPLLSVAAMVLAGYMLASSAYLHYQLEQRQQRYDQVGPALNEVLAHRTALDQAQSLVETLAEFQTKPAAAQAVWSVVALVAERDTVITGLQSDLQQLSLRGNTASATALLQLLLDQPYIQNADFNAPVRRDPQGREQFSISLQLDTKAKLQQLNAANSTSNSPAESTAGTDSVTDGGQP